jgi:hypothetical protein
MWTLVASSTDGRCTATPYKISTIPNSYPLPCSRYLAGVRQELAVRNTGSSDVVRQAGANMVETARLLRNSLPNIICDRWELGASKAVLAAQLEDIVKAMEKTRQDANTQPGHMVAPARGLGEQLLYGAV